jgi:hypothetical protein
MARSRYGGAGMNGSPPVTAPAAEPENVTEHAVLVPTTTGPVGAVVSEPDGIPAATLFLLGGAGSLVATGSAGRAGPASMWARTLRQVAALGIVAFRFDYPGVNESHQARRADDPHDLTVPRELAQWFHERTEDLPRLLAGVCFGAQLAARLATELDDLAGLALITPTLHVARGSEDAVPLGGGAAGRSDIDPRTPAAVAATLPRAPVWAFAGERELPGVTALQAELGPRGPELEVELLDGFQTKAWQTLQVHRVTRERTVAWAARIVERTGAA